MFSYPGKTFPPHNYQIELSPQEAPVIVQHGWQEFNSDNIQSIPKEEILNALYENSRNWHMVVVLCSPFVKKSSILRGLYDVIGNKLLAPTAYTKLQEFDYFLVQSSIDALSLLLDAKLKIRVGEVEVDLALKVNVAPFVFDGPNPHMGLKLKVKYCLYEKVNGTEINLTSFNVAMMKRRVELSLRFTMSLTWLIQELNSLAKQNNLKDNWVNLKLANNNIKSLAPFQQLNMKFLNELDLRNNQIEDPKEFSALQKFSINLVLLKNNPISNVPNFRQRISKLVPSLTDNKIIADPPKPGQNKIPNLPQPEIPGTSNQPMVQPQMNQVQQLAKPQQNVNESARQVAKVVPQTLTQPQPVKRNVFQTIQTPVAPITPLMALNFQPTKDPVPVVPQKPATVHWKVKVTSAISKRIFGNTLNLSHFASDPQFTDVFISMNSKIYMQHIVQQAKIKCASITIINFRGNHVSSTEAIEPLLSFPRLEKLDLRDNRIKGTFSGMQGAANLRELMLDGNPICDTFSSALDYVTEIKSHFTNLEWLDGCRVEQTAFLQNFLVTRNAFDCGNEFIKWFFNFFDSRDRSPLMDHYNVNSMFTLNIHLIPDEMSATMLSVRFNRMSCYNKFSRNLVLLSDLNRAKENLYHGSHNIGKVFNELPQTTHDVANLCVDIPFYEPNDKIVITVTGVFKEQVPPNLLFAFNRTFILQPSMNNKFEITNDLLTLSNAIQCDSNEFNKPSPEAFEDYCLDVLPTSSEEEKLKIQIFKEIAEINETECVKRLKDSRWDLKIALALFSSTL